MNDAHRREFIPFDANNNFIFPNLNIDEFVDYVSLCDYECFKSKIILDHVFKMLGVNNLFLHKVLLLLLMIIPTTFNSFY